MIVTLVAGAFILAGLLFAGSGFVGLRWREPRCPDADPSYPVPMAILIPAWREGEVVVQLVRSLLASQYPCDGIHVLVIADHCDPKVIEACRAAGAQVLALHLETSSKVRALRRGLNVLHPRWTRVVVMDADNLAHPDMLWALNRAHHRGLRVVQGRRVAKNDQTAIAILDGLMEAMHNVAFRAGQRFLGAPAHLIGSGMSFDRKVLEALVHNSEPVGGFDKQYQADLCSWGIDVGYAPSALCYDEKVSEAAHFIVQRRRWMSSQIQFLPLYLRVARDGLRQGTLSGTWLLLLALIPPRSFLVLGLVLAALAALLTGQPGLAAVCGLTLVLLAVMGFFAVGGLSALPLLKRSLPGVPVALFSMVRAAFHLPGANRSFLHTPHTQAVSIDDVLDGGAS